MDAIAGAGPGVRPADPAGTGEAAGAEAAAGAAGDASVFAGVDVGAPLLNVVEDRTSSSAVLISADKLTG